MKTIRIEIYVGQRGQTENSIESAELQETLTGWPLPRVGDYVSGRNERGQQYGAFVLWVQHRYEDHKICVYAIKS